MKKEKEATAVKKNRYSNEELQNEFKPLILNKLKKAYSDLELLTESSSSHQNKNDTNDTSRTFKVLEEGCQVSSREENSKLASRQEKFIKSLENALIRIENKTYGICRISGELICKGRLRSVPHATTTCEAKKTENSKKVKGKGRFDKEEFEEE